MILGRLSNDDSDENGKNPIGLDWQNNNFSCASCFFLHFLALVARLQHESAQFHVLLRMGMQNNNFPFVFLNFEKIANI